MKTSLVTPCLAAFTAAVRMRLEMVEYLSVVLLSSQAWPPLVVQVKSLVGRYSGLRRIHLTRSPRASKRSMKSSS